MTGGCGPSVSYVEKQITCYRPVMKEKVVDVTVPEPVYTKQMVPQTTYHCQTSMVPVTYMTLERHVEQVTKPVTIYHCEKEMVPCTYTVMVPHVTPTQKTITTYRTEYHTVTVQVPVCRVVRVPVYDPCTCCCRIVCTTVTEVVPCNRVVCNRIPEQHTVTVNACTYVPEQRQGMRCQTKVIPETRNVTCDVVRCVAVPQQCMRPITTMVPETKQVEVTVCSFKPKVVQQTVHYCEMQPYTTTVRVPVYSGCTGGVGPSGGPYY